MNTVPYTNARREGRTNNEAVEIIKREDPRHPLNHLPVHGRRASARRQGLQSGNQQRPRRTERLSPAPHPLAIAKRYELPYADVLASQRAVAAQNLRA